MLKKPLTLSIVIPVYNEERYLKACLDSIASQSEQPDEVIVVDNNSKDNTAQIAAGYSFVKVLHESRQGIVYARDTGFNRASGRLIARIDGDTILPPDWVRQIKQEFKAAGQPDYFAATSASDFRNRGPKLLWYALHRVTYFWFGRLLMGSWPLYGSNMFITNRLWRKVKAFICQRRDLHEDMDLAWHIHRLGTDVRFTAGHKNMVMARRMWLKIFYYPVMMVRIRTIRHRSGS